MAQKYSLWIVPRRDSEEYHRLDRMITEYAEQRPDSPDFEPHVTVVGGVEADESEVESEARRLTEEYGPLNLDLTKVHPSTTEHQCVFALVEPTAELLNLHIDASDALGTDEGVYVPHLSLVYGDLSVEERVRAAESIDAESLPDDVTMTHLQVVETGKPVEDWRIVNRYVL